MNVDGTHYRTIWLKPDDPAVVQIIDQRPLPHQFVIEDLTTVDQAAAAIKDMHVRGAPLIGATAAFGMYLAALQAPTDSEAAFMQAIQPAAEQLGATRPTAMTTPSGRRPTAMTAAVSIIATSRTSWPVAGSTVTIVPSCFVRTSRPDPWNHFRVSSAAS